VYLYLDWSTSIFFGRIRWGYSRWIEAWICRWTGSYKS